MQKEGLMTKKQKLYGLDLELLLEKVMAQEETKKGFLAILHEHQLVDPLGQVSYATERGIMVETKGWLTWKEIDDILAEFVRENFLYLIEYTYFPKSDPDNRTTELLTE